MIRPASKWRRRGWGVLALETVLFLAAGAFIIPSAPGVYSRVSSEISSQLTLSIPAPTALTKVSTDNNPLPAFKWTASANATSYEVKMDSGNWTDIGNRLTYVQPTVLSKATHTFLVRAKDAGGVSDASSLNFNVSVEANLANTKIAYNSPAEGQIVVMRADGSAPTALTPGSTSDFWADWSPDGSKLAFISRRDGNDNIYTMNADGSAQTGLTSHGSHDRGPAWSPDGTRIAFYSERDGNWNIYVMNSDGSGQTRLTDNTAHDYGPVWSPDAAKIAFVSQRDGNHEIYVMNTDGSGQVNLSNNSARDEPPHWSPDASKIAFVSDRDGNQEIYVMNADGTGQTRITNNAASDYRPYWSPDGSKIAFHSDRDGNQEIYSMNSNGSGQTRLTQNSANDVYPAWSPFPDSCVACWAFDEGTGTVAADSSDNGHTGTLQGSAGWATGQKGKAVDLNGTSAYVSVPDGTGLDGMTALTIDAWVYLRAYAPTSTAQVGIVFKWGAGGSSDDSYNLSLGYDGKFFLAVSGGGGESTMSQRTSNTAILLNQWKRVTATWKTPGDIHLYLDGTEVSGAYYPTTGQNTSRITDTGEPVWIGKNTSDAPGTFLNALVDEVKIYDYVPGVVLSAPTGLTKVSTDNNPLPAFKWNAVTGATNYEVKIDSGNWTGGIVNRLTYVHYVQPTALSKGSHTVQVRARESPHEGPVASLSFNVTATADLANTRIAFISDRDGNWEIYLMNPAGSNVTRLTNHPANDMQPAWSPDGSRIAFVSNGDGEQEIYVMNADGTGRTQLTNNNAEDWYPTFSADGRKIAFLSQRDGNREIYSMNADGTEQVNLTNHPADDDTPAWSSDGARIAFSSRRDGGDYNIYLMNPDGSGLTQLTTDPDTDAWPAWSPDDARIAFTRGSGAGQEIYLITSNGTNEKRLTSNAQYSQHPDWSPDGNTIVFSQGPGTASEIFVMNADGSNLVRLTYNAASEAEPAWSPFLPLSAPAGLTKVSTDNNPLPAFKWGASQIATSYEVKMDSGNWTDIGNRMTYVQLTVLSKGSHTFSVRAKSGDDVSDATSLNFNVIIEASLTNSKVAFVSNRDGNDEIYVMNVDGIGLSRLTTNADQDTAPSWSPDGSKIVFASTRDGNLEIYLMNADGSSQTRLTNNPAEEFYPSWHPDGTGIIFSSTRDRSGDVRAEIYTMNTDGSSQTRLTNDPGFKAGPTWSPDGTRISFSRGSVGGTQQIYIMNTDGTNWFNLTNDGSENGRSSWSPTGSKLVYHGASTIKTINPDGTGKTSLTGGITAAWSPDGTKLVFFQNNKVSMMNADGSAQTDIINNTASDTLPAWSPFLLLPLSAPTSLTKVSTDNNPLPAFKWSAVTGAASYEVKMGSGNWTDIGNRLTYVQPIVLSKASHTFQVRAKESAHEGPAASLSFNVTATADLANTKIAFTTNQDGQFEVYVTNADGTARTRLTNNPADDSWGVFSPDGSRIAFVSDRDGNYEIYVMNADGSSQTRLTVSGAGESSPSWSPDGLRIAFSSDRDGNLEIYVMNADGTGVTRLTNHTSNDVVPSWSPDGTKIVFRSQRDGNTEIYTMNADGSGVTRLTNNAAEDREPAWSPDGTKISFSSMRDGNNEIYVMNADGSGQTRLTNHPAHDGYFGLPSWSPDGAKITFQSTRDGAEYVNEEIYSMNADGSGVTRITNNTAQDLWPFWSPFLPLALVTPTGLTKVSTDNNPLPAFKWSAVPGATSYEIKMDSGNWTDIGNRLTYVQPTALSKGSHTVQVRARDSTGTSPAASLSFNVTVDANLANTRIAFFSNRDGNEEIYTMNVAGAGQTRLTVNLAHDNEARWSPDGSKIAFTSYRDGQQEIYTMNADGSGQTRLTTNPASDRLSAWSPDGSKIVFTSDRDGNNDIYIMNVNGTGQTRLTTTANNAYGAWSPDGNRIAFLSSRDGNFEIYVMNADGSNQTRFTNNSAADMFPEWSPDGSKIAFRSNRDGNLEIYITNTDGSGQMRLTNNMWDDYYQSWAPDGSQIAFTSDRDGHAEIYIMNPDGSSQTRLTNNSSYYNQMPSWSPFLPGAPAAPTGLIKVSTDNNPLPAFKWSASANATSYEVKMNSGNWTGIGNWLTYVQPTVLSKGSHTFQVRAKDLWSSTSSAASLSFNVTVTADLANTKIALTSQGDDVWVMNADGSNRTQLINRPDQNQYPAWSPDGSKIAFYSNRDGNDEIYVMNADSSAQIRLTNSSAQDVQPVWSPDGTKIAFSSDRDGNRDIYVMNAGGTGQTRLTNHSGDDNFPSWSPDGSKIAFASNRDGNREIYLMNADGTGQARLTNNLAQDVFPAWSPDGTKLVFSREVDVAGGNYGIYLMNADGTGETRLTAELDDDRPTWSPDGSRIAFTGHRGFGQAAIFVMNADGSAETLLDASWQNFAPAWSPFLPVASAPPLVTLTPLAPDPTNDNTPTFTGTATATSSTIASVEYRVDSGSWTAASPVDGAFNSASENYTFTASALADGQHTVQVRATDAAGLVTASANYASDTFRVDSVAPSVTLTALSPDPTSDNTPTFTGTATDNATSIASVEYRVDSGSWIAAAAADGAFNSASENYTFTTTNLIDGAHTVQVRAIDAAGNPTPAASYAADSFTVATVAPVVTITALSPDPTIDNTPTFTGRATDNSTSITSVQYRVDGGGWLAATAVDGAFNSNSENFTFTIAALADGAHTVEARATNAASVTTAPANYAVDAFIVDTVVPAVALTALTPDPTNDNTSAFTGRATDNSTSIASVEYRVDGGSWIAATAADGSFNSSSENYTFTTVALSDGPHTVQVRATDAAGNATPVASYAADSFVIDTIAPVVMITALSPDPTRDDTPTFNGTATDNASSIASVEYRVDSGNWTSASPVDGAFNSTNETYTFTTAALPDGLHTVQVRATDAAGNIVPAANYASDSFMVETPKPPSVTTNPAASMTATSAILSGNLTNMGTAGSVSVSFQWGLASGNYTNETAAQSRNVTGVFSQSLASLSANTIYYFRAKAVGDGTSYGSERSFTTAPPANTAPVVSNVTASQIPGTGTVNVTYNLADTEQATVTVTLSFWSGSAWLNAATTNGSIGTIVPGNGRSATWNAKADFDGQNRTDVKIKVAANDGQSNNNTGTAESLQFSLDTKAPTGAGLAVPADGGASPINPTLAVAPASDSSAPVQYNFFIAKNSGFTDNVQTSGWQAATTWQPQTLLPLTSYWWKAQVRDAYGNSANYGDIWQFTTTSFASVSVRLEPGLNLVSLPVQPPTPLSSQTLLQQINSQGGSAVRVDRWNEALGRWESRLSNPPIGTIFPIEVGRGYFVISASNSTWTLQGYLLRKAVPPFGPEITNVTDRAFSVSWGTASPESGYIEWGTTSSLNMTAYDDRGVGVVDDTHHITVRNLTAGTVYYYDIIRGGVRDNNGGAHYQVTTGPTLTGPGSHPVFGKAFKSDGTTPAEGTIVYVRVKDIDRLGSTGVSQTYSAVVDSSGYWSVNLGTVRTTSLTIWFTYSAAADKLIVEAKGGVDGSTSTEVNFPAKTEDPVGDVFIGLVQTRFASGLNLFALPAEPATSYTSETLLQAINSQGGSAIEIDRWDESQGMWVSYIIGKPFGIFPIEVGRGYFIRSVSGSIWKMTPRLN